MKKHKFHTTTIQHHSDGSATIHHMHESPEKDVKHAVGNHDEMMDSMMDHLSEPNDGEDRDAEDKEYEKSEALEEKLAPGLHAKMAAMGMPEKY